jgi:hypothetical protein
MNYFALKGEVSDFSTKNLSMDRKLWAFGPEVLRGFIPPPSYMAGKKFALKPARGSVQRAVHPRVPIKIRGKLWRKIL